MLVSVRCGHIIVRCPTFGHIHAPVWWGWVAFFFLVFGQLSHTVTACPLLGCCPPVITPDSWVLVVAVVDCVESQWSTRPMVY